MSRILKDKEWSKYPLGTKAYAYNGGYWIRVENGWKWHCGDTFPQPGADAFGECIELPEKRIDYSNRWEIVIEAENPQGAMAAVWAMWEAWRDSKEPLGGACPNSIGNAYSYEVKKTKGGILCEK